MEKNELNLILDNLYQIDPSLKAHESELIGLIQKMSDLKPDTKFDEAFAARLKAQLLELDKQSAPVNSKLFIFNFMDKKIYWAAGAFAAASLAFLFALPALLPNQIQSNQENQDAKVSVFDSKITTGTVKLAKGAFGSLSNLDSLSVPTSNLISASPKSAPAGAGSTAGSAESYGVRGVVSVNADTSTSPPANAEIDGSVSTPAAAPDQAVGSSKMIMPPAYSFKYVYAGDKLELKESQQDVFRRLKGDGQMSKDLVGLISTSDFGVLDLKAFSNLKLTNLSLSEDKDLGLLINFDFNDDNVYIYENWLKWRNLEREACGSDQGCWDRYRLTINQVPADESLIALSNRFMTEHQIDLKNYAQPVVDNAWREDYNRYENKNDYYIPEYATVIYPLLVNGVEVRDQSGAYTGLRININLLKSAVSGLSGLTPYRYESSSYDLETDFSRLITVAENGGWNRIYYYRSEQDNTAVVELGTPTESLVQSWKYVDGRSEELFVPALVFPIIKAPAENYYGPKFITVPLVKEMVDELTKVPEIPTGVIEPMLIRSAR